MEAMAEVASQDRRRMLPLEELYIGPGKSSLHPQEEILVGFSIPVSDRITASCFQRVMRPQGVAIAILNMGVSLIRSGSTIEELRISVGPGGKIPFRARAVERLLGGREFTPAWIGEGIERLRREASFRTSRHRATQAYRLHMAGVLLEYTLKTAWQRSFAQDQEY
jgi:CO/xanthine dehydrogenase FAD-binding subunit